MLGRRSLLLAAVIGAWVAAASAGPFDITLLTTEKAGEAKGSARLIYATSPFGVSVTVDGRARYDVQITVSGLPDPATLDAAGFVAFAATPNLSRWTRLGVVRNGTTTAGHIEDNKFMLVISAERDTMTAAKTGATMMHGISPSAWLQSFLSHPLFRGAQQ